MKMHDFLINITNDTKSNENPILKSRDQKKHKGFSIQTMTRIEDQT